MDLRAAEYQTVERAHFGLTFASASVTAAPRRLNCQNGRARTRLCVISEIPQQLLLEWPSIFERFALNAEKHLVQMLPSCTQGAIDFASEYFLSLAFQ